jgi:hypothetical protein
VRRAKDAACVCFRDEREANALLRRKQMRTSNAGRESEDLRYLGRASTSFCRLRRRAYACMSTKIRAEALQGRALRYLASTAALPAAHESCKILGVVIQRRQGRVLCKTKKC